MRRTQLLCFALVVLVPSLALADSIDPVSFSATINVGETVRLTKTVTADGRTFDGPLDVVLRNRLKAGFRLFHLVSQTGRRRDAGSARATPAADLWGTR